MTKTSVAHAATAGVLACVLAAAVPAAQAQEPPSTLDAALGYAPLAQDITEAQLDQVIAVYTYEGAAHEISARDVIEDNADLEGRLNADGTYACPTTEDVVTYVRNQILNDLVAKAGVEVSDEELAAYMMTSFGVADVDTIATYYGLDAAKAERILREGAAVTKLRDQVVGSVGEAPAVPESPSDGNAAALTADYAAYILGLAADDWDAAAGSWVEGSPFASALSAYGFTGEQASYDMAVAAYRVAYAAYADAVNAQFEAWSAYANSFLSQATLAVFTLKS